MNQYKTGELIRKLRMEKGLTQQQLADVIHVSDKAVSKWERGLGLPDVSLLKDLSKFLGVSAEILLSGEMAPSSTKGGNMKRIKFYVCPECGNIISATAAAEVSCCGRRLEPLEAHQPDDAHKLDFEEMDNELYITFDHPMTKDHYLNFVAWAGYDRVTLVHLYPEQGGELRLPAFRGGCYYYGCTKHGLFTMRRK